MPYRGLQRFADTEIINVERLQAYVRNGVGPAEGTITVYDVYPGLAAAVWGDTDTEYQTPVLDKAPWYDVDNPDTWDFAGILPVTSTGLDDTTRTVTVTPTVRSGGIADRPVYGPRTSGQTVLLVGRSTAGVQAGLAWLTDVLHGTCRFPDADPTGTLETLTTASTPVVLADLDADPIVTTVNDPTHTAPDAPYVWWVRAGTFTRQDTYGGGSGTILVPYDQADAYVGGTAPETGDVLSGGTAGEGQDFYNAGNATTSPAGYMGDTYTGGDASTGQGDTIDGGGADPQPQTVDAGGAGDTIYLDGGDAYGAVDTVDGGGAYTTADLTPANNAGYANPVGQAIIATDLRGCTQGPVVVVWRLRKPSQHTPTVKMVLVDDAAEIVAYGPVLDLSTTTTSDGLVDYTWEFPDGVQLDAWRAALLVSDAALTVRNQVTYVQPTIDPGVCLQTYRRFYPHTTVIDGPSVSNTYQVGCVDLLQVEWTYVSGSPFRYGTTNVVVTGARLVPASLDSASPRPPRATVTYADSSIRFGTRVNSNNTLSATRWNCPAPTDEVSCALDPSYPGYATGPALPNVPDPGRVTIGGAQVREFWVMAGPEVIPTEGGVFTITLTAGTNPVVGARVRVYTTGDANGNYPDPCDFAYEYLIDYIPAQGVMTIDGVEEKITTVCQGSTVPADSTGSVRGDFGGPWEVPVASCDQRYVFEVMWLDKYPRNGGSQYSSGGSEGSLSMDVGVTVREG